MLLDVVYHRHTYSPHNDREKLHKGTPELSAKEHPGRNTDITENRLQRRALPRGRKLSSELGVRPTFLSQHDLYLSAFISTWNEVGGLASRYLSHAKHQITTLGEICSDMFQHFHLLYLEFLF